MKKFRFHQAREVFSAIFDLGLLYTVSGRSESAAQHHIKLTLKIMETNRIHPIDDVMIEIYEEGHRVGAIQRSGFNNVSEAVEAAYEGSRATHNPIEDYVWKVTNLSTGTSARYRVNAGGHLRILPEEHA